MSLRVLRFLLVGAFFLGCSCLSASLRAEEVLPDSVQTQSPVQLEEVGSGTYRKFGFGIYHATLWAPEGVWNTAKPYALELHYLRSLSKSTMVSSTIDNIRDERVADDATLARWASNITDTMPAVEDGDIMIGLTVPGHDTILYFNGKQIMKTQDQAFTQAFFNIWLGDGADEDLRNALLKSAQ